MTLQISATVSLVNKSFTSFNKDFNIKYLSTQNSDTASDSLSIKTYQTKVYICNIFTERKSFMYSYLHF